MVSFRRHAKWHRTIENARSEADYSAKYSAGMSVQIYEQDDNGNLTHLETIRHKRWNEIKGVK